MNCLICARHCIQLFIVDSTVILSVKLIALPKGKPERQCRKAGIKGITMAKKKSLPVSGYIYLNCVCWAKEMSGKHLSSDLSKLSAGLDSSYRSPAIAPV